MQPHRKLHCFDAPGQKNPGFVSGCVSVETEHSRPRRLETVVNTFVFGLCETSEWQARNLISKNAEAVGKSPTRNTATMQPPCGFCGFALCWSDVVAAAAAAAAAAGAGADAGADADAGAVAVVVVVVVVVLLLLMLLLWVWLWLLALLSLQTVFVVPKSEAQPTHGLLPSSDQAAGRAGGIVDDDIRLPAHTSLAKGSMSSGFMRRKANNIRKINEDAKSASDLPSRRKHFDLHPLPPLPTWEKHPMTDPVALSHV